MGPLAGIKVVELAGIGPAPMCAMLLADMGATVLRIERPGGSGLGLARPLRYDLLLRGRRSVAVDLKSPDGKALALRLVERADALIEGFRPGVTERLGLGPEDCLARNPGLVYGRVTGWGQDGPLAQAAGHDLNYIALAGALHAFGRRGQPPTPPLNLLGDFAGGALYLAFGLVCAIIEARQSGQGQVVDAAMVDGVASLMTTFHGAVAAGLSTHERGTNHLDTGAHFYNVYECADGRWISVAPIEGKFYAELLRRLDLDPASLPPQMDREHWPEAQARFAELFKTRTQRGMVRRAGRHRRLLCPGADHRRGARSPAQRRARHLCRDRRDRPAGAGAALFADGSRPADPAAGHQPRNRRSRPRRLARPGRDRRPQSRRHDRLRRRPSEVAGAGPQPLTGLSDLAPGRGSRNMAQFGLEPGRAGAGRIGWRHRSAVP